MRSRWLMGFLCVLLLWLEQSVGAAPLSQSSPYMIKLRSRQFMPRAGIERAAREQLERETRPQHVLLQLRDIPTEDERGALAAQGIHLLNYLPDYAWFAAIEPQATPRLNSLTALHWVGDIEVADKLPAHLFKGNPAARVVNPDGTLALKVYYFEDVTEADALKTVARYDGFVTERAALFHSLAVHLPIQQLWALAAEDGIRWIEEVPPPPTPLNDSIRAKMRVNEVQAAPYNLTGAGVKFGLWDCGPIGSHIDFTGRLTNVFGQAGIASPCNHATHVAGTLAGNGAHSQSQGGAAFQWKGVAPSAQIFAYDFFTSTTEVASAISAYDIDVSQNSWGFTPSSEPCGQVLGNYNNLAPEYDQLVRGSGGKRLSVVFAAGNSQTTYSGQTPPCLGFNTILPPATAKNVIAVGATNVNDDSMTGFSAWGPTDDGRLKPDVVAPGARSDGINGNRIKSTYPNDVYNLEFGTSMAAPAVSGLLGLLLEQYRINTGQPTTSPLPSTLKALMAHGAVDLGNTGPDYKFGYGRVDAKNSVDLARGKKYRQGSLTYPQVVTYTVKVFGCEPSLKVTLAWDDVAGSENAIPALINDLDVTLIAPNNTQYYPWSLDPNQPSTPAVQSFVGNHLDNVEQVVVNNPMAGDWTIRVSGLVVFSPQDFSLVSEAYSDLAINNCSPYIATAGSPVALQGNFSLCASQTLAVNLSNGQSIGIAPSNCTTNAITFTAPLTATSGAITVTAGAYTSNVAYLAIVEPRVHLPLMLKNFPPPFNWIDASDGARIADGDDVTTTISIPFPFRFYGITYTQVTVSSNGLISFSPLTSTFPNSHCVPTTTLPNNAIYAFWTDLDPSAHGAVWSKIVSNSLVIEWQEVPRFGTYPTSELQTFEIILNADNSIYIQYLNVANLNGLTIGVENATGTAAQQTYCSASNPPQGREPANQRLFYYTTPE